MTYSIYALPNLCSCEMKYKIRLNKHVTPNSYITDEQHCIYAFSGNVKGITDAD